MSGAHASPATTVSRSSGRRVSTMAAPKISAATPKRANTSVATVRPGSASRSTTNVPPHSAVAIAMAETARRDAPAAEAGIARINPARDGTRRPRSSRAPAGAGGARPPA